MSCTPLSPRCSFWPRFSSRRPRAQATLAGAPQVARAALLSRSRRMTLSHFSRNSRTPQPQRIIIRTPTPRVSSRWKRHRLLHGGQLVQRDLYQCAWYAHPGSFERLTLSDRSYDDDADCRTFVFPSERFSGDAEVRRECREFHASSRHRLGATHSVRPEGIGVFFLKLNLFADRRAALRAWSQQKNLGGRTKNGG